MRIFACSLHTNVVSAVSDLKMVRYFKYNDVTPSLKTSKQQKITFKLRTKVILVDCLPSLVQSPLNYDLLLFT